MANTAVESAPAVEHTAGNVDNAGSTRNGEEETSNNAHSSEAVKGKTNQTQQSNPSAVAEGARVKVQGLVKAAQYNGLSGKVLRIDQESQRVELRLEGGKELKVKLENVKVVQTLGGFKGGFIKQAGKIWDDEPTPAKPQHKLDHLNPMQQLQAVGASQSSDKPEWMKPGRDLFDKMQADDELSKGANNRKLLEAVAEIERNPEAWEKYQHDPEIAAYFEKMMGLFGEQYEKQEKKKDATEQKGKEFNVKEALFAPTEPDQDKAKQESGNSKADGPCFAKKGFLKDKFSKPKPPPEPTISRTLGGTDYSKFDFIESESDDEEEFTGKLGKGVRSLLADAGKGSLSKKDPKIANALGDPKVQRVLRELKTCEDPERIAKLINSGDVREKMQVLIKTGALDLDAPSYGKAHPKTPAAQPPGMPPGMMNPGMMHPGMMNPGMMPPGMQRPATKLDRWMMRTAMNQAQQNAA